MTELNALYQMFPALEEKISQFEGDIDVLDYTNAEDSCTAFGLCIKQNIAQMLLDEMPVDLSGHIEYVNNNPNATW